MLYDADVDAIDGIREVGAGDGSELIAISACLADMDSEATLNLYLNPGLTSLRKLNPKLPRHVYVHQFGIDFDAGSGRLLEQRKIHTQRLDSLMAANPSYPPPDFLTLDVQGGEYEVLVGGRQTLERHVCGVIAEVIFAEAYQGQKRFQEIFDLLDGQGFIFTRFLTLDEGSGPAGPLGFRGTGYQVSADALFLRRPATFSPALENRPEKLMKLCFAAIIFGNIELAAECLELLADAPAASSTTAHGCGYADFVVACADVYKRSVKVRPPVFTSILPPHRDADFAKGAPPEQWPHLLEGLRGFDDAYREALVELQDTADSEFEALLRANGFVEQADQVNFLRRHQAYHSMRNIDAAKNGR